MRLKPDSVNALINRGYVYEQMKQFDKARADYESRPQARPEGPGAGRETSAGIALKQNKPKEALALFDEALRIDPVHVESLYNRGVVHMALEDLDKAIADYTEAASLDPTFWKAYHSRAVA